MLTAALRALPRGVVQRVARRVLQVEPASLIVRNFDGHPMVVRLGTPDEKVLDRESFARDPYLAMIPDYTIGTDHVIVHVGAHVGGFAVHAATRASRVYAIEACRETYLLLKANAALNNRENLIATHAALSDRRGTVTLYRSDRGNWGNSLFRHGTYQGEESVPAMSLRDYFSEQRITHCHLLTLNCEGAEFPILMSTPSEVLARVDRIIVRYHCDLVAEYGPDDLPRFLEAQGFSCRLIPDKGMPQQRGTTVACRRA